MTAALDTAATDAGFPVVSDAPTNDGAVIDVPAAAACLARYDAACRALAEARTIDVISQIHDEAVALHAATRVAGNREMEIDAAKIRIRAERILGEKMLNKSTIGLAKGGRPYQRSTGFETNPVTRPKTLREVGVDKNLAHRARRLAALPETDFTKMLVDWRTRVGRGTERVTARLLRTEEGLRRNAEIRTGDRPLPVGRYSVIYADPPWTYRAHSGEGAARSAESHYPTMTQAAIEALPVASLAADDCALFLWAVMPQIAEALSVISAWGFAFKTCAFVWVKQTQDGQRLATGMGNWTRANVEICLLATRGSPKRLNADVHQVVLAPRLEHSRKPDEVAARIERLVAGPYIELFARSARPGWSAWGNQVDAGAGEAGPVGALHPAGREAGHAG